MNPDGAACAEVLLDLAARGTERRLTYRVPDSLRASVQVGSRVAVPLGPRIVRGFVIALAPCDPSSELAIRDILAVAGARPLFAPRMLELARWIAEQTVSTLLEAVHCLAPPEIFRRRSPAPRSCNAALGEEGGPVRRVGPRQARILSALRTRGEVPVEELVREGGRPAFRRLLAHGAVRVSERPLPGAGDGTAPRVPPRSAPPDAGAAPMLIWGDAVARRAWIAEHATATAGRGGQALVIVPEIAMVPLYLRLLAPTLGEAAVALHSGMTPRLRQAAWGRCVSGEARVVVGTRSALFAPLDVMRLIVVDDEHDPAHQADAAPRYHARGVALRRGMLEGARVVLGSMTPSVETYAQVASGRVECVRLPPAAPPARVTLVDMRVERARGRRGLLTPALVAAIRRHVRAGGRVALFVNRTGYARVLLCDECGFALRCPRCAVAMRFDRVARTVFCNMCGEAGPAPGTCPRCGGVGLRPLGPGTERVEEVVRRLFPALRMARVDRGTADQFDRIAKEFASGQVRLLVGTQMLLRAGEIHPTLIGVCDADLPLHLPDFRGAERTLQQLRAVISIAAGPDPEAVVQTRLPDHPAVRALVTGDDEAVYRGELAVRRELGYPPYAALARVVASHAARETAARLAAQVAETSRACGVEVLGPAPARDPGAGATFRYQCLLRSADPAAVRAAARAALGTAPAKQGGRVTVEMDPQEFH